MSAEPLTKGLLERLAQGPVICAEGYLFEFERRGYLQAGAYVPEIVLEHPDLVAGLHREFVHAGSDVVEAFTYYAHREKLRLIGKEHLLEPLNREALAIASGSRVSTASLAAGNLSNTNVFIRRRGDAATWCARCSRSKCGWIVDAGVDFIIAETFSYAGEARSRSKRSSRAGLPAVVTLSVHQQARDARGLSPAEAVQAAGRRRGRRRRAQLHPRARDHAAADPRDPRGGRRLCRRPPGALPHERRGAELPIAHRCRLCLPTPRAPVSDSAGPPLVQPLRDRRVRARGARARRPLSGGVLRRRPAHDSQPWPRRSAASPRRAASARI